MKNRRPQIRPHDVHLCPLFQAKGKNPKSGRLWTCLDIKVDVKVDVSKMLNTLIYSILDRYMYIYVHIKYTPIIFSLFLFTVLLGYRASLCRYLYIKGGGWTSKSGRLKEKTPGTLISKQIQQKSGRPPEKLILTVRPYSNGSSQKSLNLTWTGVCLSCNQKTKLWTE